VGALLDDPEKRDRMAEAAREHAHPDAAETIARDVLALADRYHTN
jgi:UDP-N-acetylglucosamine--N-acetylmuramyl-(pentapeptide) pyrophosphoryl-undecaprenol N-acetylglucosamine transferase